MEGVSLRPITLSDADDIVRWRNSDAVRQNMQDQHIITVEQHRNYHQSFIEKGIIVQYIIVVNSKAIGTVYYKIHNNTQVELGLFIGEEGYRGKGYGRYALKTILSEIRSKGFVKSIIKVRKSNFNALRLYDSIGFSYVRDIADGFAEMELI